MGFWKTLFLLIITGVFVIIFVTTPIAEVNKELKLVRTGLETLNARLNKSSLLKF